MIKLCHGVGRHTVAIFGGCAMWLFFQSSLASNLSLGAIYPWGSSMIGAFLKTQRQNYLAYVRRRYVSTVQRTFTLGACCNSFFVFVSDRSRSGSAENRTHVFLKNWAVNKNRLFLPILSIEWIPP
jgi:hypothetical protein